MKLKIIRIILIAVLSISLVSSPVGIVNARSIQDIQADIDAQNNSLAQVQKDLDAAQADLAAQQATLDATSGQIPQLQAQITQITSKINYNTLQIQSLQQKQHLYQLEKEQREKKQTQTVDSGYISWRSDSVMSGYLPNTQDTPELKLDTYHYDVMQLENEDLDTLVAQLTKITADLTKLQKQTGDLQTQNTTLASQKTALEAQVAELQNGVQFSAGEVDNLQNSARNIQDQITFLSAEQKEAEQREQAALQGGGYVDNAGCDGASVAAGHIYFCGQGRDLYMGHGVGMSQYGAAGAADQGLTANQILQFYYPGIQITSGYESSTVHLSDGSTLNVEDYVAGQGEVPGRACGTQAQVDARPDKYVLSSGYCWPEEAIKAQAIAYRTYGVYHANFLYPDSRSQAYNGTTYTSWVANETKGQVITYGGSVVEALYSADNNQGYGTADVGTRFQDFWGNPDSTAPYLISVNDNQYAQSSRLYWGGSDYCGSYACGFWPWKTQTYSYADIDSLITYAAANIAGEMNSVKSTVGNVTDVTFIKDPSFRIKQVIITGNSGQVTIGGWWFKYMWNVWTDAIGKQDFIYSQTVNTVK